MIALGSKRAEIHFLAGKSSLVFSHCHFKVAVLSAKLADLLLESLDALCLSIKMSMMRLAHGLAMYLGSLVLGETSGFRAVHLGIVSKGCQLVHALSEQRGLFLKAGVIAGYSTERLDLILQLWDKGCSAGGMVLILKISATMLHLYIPL